MKHGTYIGDRADLKGKTALLRLRSVTVGAQFDDLKLDQSLTHGWTEFPATDWEVDEETDWTLGQRNVKRSGNDWEV
jgi:hypothetical protein